MVAGILLFATYVTVNHTYILYQDYLTQICDTVLCYLASTLKMYYFRTTVLLLYSNMLCGILINIMFQAGDGSMKMDTYAKTVSGP